MNGEQLETKEKILNATIDIVGMKGEATIREITEKAGVNVASINYYFGNKNNLLKEVENYYAEKLLKSGYDILLDTTLTPQNRIFKWALNLIEYMYKYPALISIIVKLTHDDKSYNPVIIKKIYFNDEVQKIVENIIKDITKIEDSRVLNFKYLQLFSGILGTVINHVVVSIYGDEKSILNISDSEELRQYLVLLIESILR
ncbi:MULTISPECIES: TetR/AcrR family transcriptional regulator [unclassified Thermoanaerobacterium]|uniref:TetR/AcrR family transcriptional regulator n=1 Tax=unclassified Thermoanaerobacterium TaxID=2622527 RepID=UPI000A1589C8|nr:MULTISPECIES: TetR/AcrR family transcriptional regulator [unclassified Thermoanaerobacterium]MDE4541388.1 TetR/AcrR family transcriptional regulator [Thermoanaerobacterium sp. R66]ORX23079.1 TetR family transcriptional regulator [Thermoanaerobacterium sp. PSU-2]